MIPRHILEALNDFFEQDRDKGFRILSSRALGGGSINEVYCLETSKGSFCLKFNTNAYPGMFQAEASGLELLSRPSAIRVPRVVFTKTLADYSFIVMEFIEQAPRIKDFYRDFGRQLSALHRNHSAEFGLDHDNYMGSLPQSNKKHSGWNEFFREERLLPQVRLAVDSGMLERSTVRLFESLYSRLPSILPEEKPCLVHGDLWSGNYIVSEEGRACIIDPAVYYGSREIDLAMSTLFGGFSPDFYEAYHESYPLVSGWKERLDLLNLYPLLIHLNLFGRGYLGQILSILRRF